MKSRIDKNLKPAIDFINAGNGFFKKGTQKVQKAYKGYISSFGTMLMQNGLKASVILFAGDSSGEADKKIILNALYHLRHEGTKDIDKSKAYKNMVEEVLAMNDEQQAAERDRYLDLAIALKMAMRTFEFE